MFNITYKKINNKLYVLLSYNNKIINIITDLKNLNDIIKYNNHNLLN